MFKIKLSEMAKQILFICICIVTYIFILFNISNITLGLNSILALITPFLLGFVLAYLLNPLIQFLRKSFKKIFRRNFSTGFCMFIAYLVLFLCAIILCIIILPQIWASLDVIIRDIPEALKSLYSWVEKDVLTYIGEITNGFFSVDTLMTSFSSNIEGIIKSLSENFTKVISATLGFTTFILNVVLSVIISIYMLSHKDLYKGQIIKCLFAFFSEEKAENVIMFFRKVNDTFSKFLGARIIDSVIIGVLCYIGCLILGLNNALLIAFIVGVTNVIPYFGPFLGAIPCSLIVLLEGPGSMLIFIIFILILQQFDGNILGPKLLGDSLGLTSLWIIFSVVVMTGLFGLVGMLLGVPLFTIIYMMIKNIVYKKLELKGKSTNTDDYIKEE